LVSQASQVASRHGTSKAPETPLKSGSNDHRGETFGDGG
jgi:hypothetical protein